MAVVVVGAWEAKRTVLVKLHVAFPADPLKLEAATRMLRSGFLTGLHRVRCYPPKSLAEWMVTPPVCPTANS